MVFMPYLIDGHNLIPDLPGFSLKYIDDELKLIHLLQEFCRLKHKQVEVYFDNAPNGFTKTQKLGSVTAHFVPKGQTADTAIQMRLKALGNAAKNWTVVSSDHWVQNRAHESHTRIIDSKTFANQMITLFKTAEILIETNSHKAMENDIDEWLKIFGDNDALEE
jgi:predicted RNA-binding protein with PIN domain